MSDDTTKTETPPAKPPEAPVWNNLRSIAEAMGRRLSLKWIMGAALLLFIASRFSGTGWIEAWRTVYEPDGAIFVDSPEVYTRERLINERLAEDAWLNEQLEKADDDEYIRGIERRIEQNTKIASPGETAAQPPEPGNEPGDKGSGTPDAGGAGTLATADKSSTVSHLTFDDILRIKDANRDFVIQKIVENRLDDRHDLLGNSLYILKFDTTVLLNSYSSRKALIRIEIEPPIDLPARPEGGDGRGSTAALSFGGVDFVRALSLDRGSLDVVTHSMTKFLEDVRDRVNRIGAGMLAGKSLEAEKLTAAIADEFGMAPQDVYLEQLKDQFAYELVIEPLADFFVLRTYYGESASDEDKAKALSSFQSIPNQGFFDVEEGDCPDGRATTISLDGLDALKKVLGGKSGQARIRFESKLHFLWPHIRAILETIDRAGLEELTAGQARLIIPWGTLALDLKAPIFDSRTRAESTCVMLRGSIKTGLMQFAGRMSLFNTYSYSVLPRQSPVAVTEEIVTSSSLKGRGFLPFGLDSQPSLLNIEAGNTSSSRRQRLAARVTSFGYTAARDGGDDERLIVGWIIDPQAGPVSVVDDEFVSASESVMAIVSVPAWWPFLKLKVARQWLSNSGKLVPARGLFDNRSLSLEAAKNTAPPTGDGWISTQTVVLPNSQQLLESSVIATERRKPQISQVECKVVSEQQPPSSPEKPETAKTTNTIRCMVMGKRLWRNTLVSLGSLPHRKLTILPNMEGLLVDFGGADSNCVSTKIRVWTSEGMDESEELLCPRLPEPAEAAP